MFFNEKFCLRYGYAFLLFGSAGAHTYPKSGQAAPSPPPVECNRHLIAESPDEDVRMLLDIPSSIYNVIGDQLTLKSVNICFDNTLVLRL